MPTDKTLSNLVINRIPTQEIYNKLKERNLINEDELYLVEEDSGNPDWNQNDETAPDYIKNRTHWIEVNDDIFFEGDVLNNNNHYSRSFTLLKPLALGERYTVVYDGVTYENLEVIYVPQEGFGPPYGEAEYWYLGNTIELGFRLAWYDENTTEVYLEYLQSEAESHSLRVFQSHDVVHQLNSKYLPSEEWVFTLEDGSTVTKKVVLG